MGRPSRPLISILKKLEIPEITSLYSQLNSRQSLWLTEALIQMGLAPQVLEDLPEPQIERLLEDLSQPQVLSILQNCTPDLAAFFLEFLDDDVVSQLLAELPREESRKIRQFLEYPEDSVGRVMQTNVFALPLAVTAGEGLDLIRSRVQEESIYYIYCVNEEDQLVGVISLRQLAIQSLSTPLEKIVKRKASVL